MLGTELSQKSLDFLNIAGLLVGRGKHEVRHQAVCGRRQRRGRAGLEGLLAAMSHRTSLQGPPRLWPHRLPVQVQGICGPGERGLPARGRAQCPLARGPHVHLFRLPDLHRIGHGTDRQGDSESPQGLREVAAGRVRGISALICLLAQPMRSNQSRGAFENARDCWSPHGNTMEKHLSTYGLPMDLLWTSYGLPMDSTAPDIRI